MHRSGIDGLRIRGGTTQIEFVYSSTICQDQFKNDSSELILNKRKKKNEQFYEHNRMTTITKAAKRKINYNLRGRFPQNTVHPNSAYLSIRQFTQISNES